MPVPPPRRRGWRWAVPVVALAAGLLMATSAVTARGTDLRASRTMPLSQLVEREQAGVAALSRQVTDLRSRVSATAAAAAGGGAAARRVRVATARLAAAAGLTPVSGPGVTVRLDDAGRADQQRDLTAGAQPDDLVIHQQDVQAVVNALWAGGADAMAIMGERVVATSAVRCVGNTLLLHGRVFSPPYVVTAVGPTRRMLASLDASPDVQVLEQYVAAYGLRYKTQALSRVRLSGYDGTLELGQAEAVR